MHTSGDTGERGTDRRRTCENCRVQNTQANGATHQSVQLQPSARNADNKDLHQPKESKAADIDACAEQNEQRVEIANARDRKHTVAEQTKEAQPSHVVLAQLQRCAHADRDCIGAPLN